MKQVQDDIPFFSTDAKSCVSTKQSLARQSQFQTAINNLNGEALNEVKPRNGVAIETPYFGKLSTGMHRNPETPQAMKPRNGEAT